MIKNIIELSNEKAKDFFLENKNYCSIDLPPYFKFDGLLKKISSELGNKNLSDYFDNGNPKDFEKVNHVIVGNKDGKYAWRPFSLIHPAIYVDLVNKITEKDNWKSLQNRFKEFKNDEKISCLSLPVVSQERKDNTKDQILTWWQEVEQESIRLALEYRYMFITDITNCYGSIYTHSIAWALHTKEISKEERENKNLLGNVIDNDIRRMNCGQTNGIPQGSVLSDFIAEMVLGYSDLLLSEELEEIKDFKILRYRDDYRIFVNDSSTGERILKNLSEILLDLNFALNKEKTVKTDEIILSSIKKDKMALVCAGENKTYSTLQKELLSIYDFSLKYPNSGSLQILLNKFYDKFKKKSNLGKKEILVLISILTEIMYKNPRIIPVGAAILSIFFNFIKEKEEKKDLIKKIHEKFLRMPNTSLLEIWLQRMTYNIDDERDYKEKLCKKVNDKNTNIWENRWMNKNFSNMIDQYDVVDREQIENLNDTISKSEFDIFWRY